MDLTTITRLFEIKPGEEILLAYSPVDDKIRLVLSRTLDLVFEYNGKEGRMKTILEAIDDEGSLPITLPDHYFSVGEL